jgi:hypothetical protein
MTPGGLCNVRQPGEAGFENQPAVISTDVHAARKLHGDAAAHRVSENDAPERIGLPTDELGPGDLASM